MKAKETLFTLFFLFTLSLQVFAQDFDYYLNKTTDTWRKNESLNQFLKRNGYISKKVNWQLITMGLNQFDRNTLINHKREDLELKLPPKMKISKSKKPARSIASSKMSCQIISRKYINERLKPEAKYYLRYIEMVAERKVKVTKGQKIIDLLKNDRFEYKSLKKAYLHTLRDNKLKGNTVQKSMTVTLPFCASKGIKRSIAALNTNVTEMKSERKSLLPIPINIGMTLGQFSVNQDSRELSMNFLRLQLSGKYQLSSDYILSGKASAATFTNIKYSEAIGETNFSNFYPEFGASISTKAGSFSYGFSFDRINYFLIKDESDSITLEPNQLNKISVNGYYSISDGLGIFANAGYMNGFNSENISGYDLSLGGSFAFGNQNRYKVSPLMYYGSVNSNLSTEAEISNAFALSFSVDF